MGGCTGWGFGSSEKKQPFPKKCQKVQSANKKSAKQVQKKGGEKSIHSSTLSKFQSESHELSLSSSSSSSSSSATMAKLASVASWPRRSRTALLSVSIRDAVVVEDGDDKVPPW